MTKTDILIERLSAEAVARKPFPTPAKLFARLACVLVLYGVLVSAMLGLRADLGVQLARPFFSVEIVLLVAIALVSLRTSVHLAFPDTYQKRRAARLPGLLLLAFILVLAVQALLPPDSRMLLPSGPHLHQMECTLCIAGSAFMPALILFGMLRSGASIHPLKAGIAATLAASAVGCLTLRLAEANDSLVHLALAHYLPIVVFAGVGAAAGRLLLRW